MNPGTASIVLIRSKRVSSAGLILLFLGATAWAQVTASITGAVKDTSGAVIPDVTVTAKNLESGLTRTAQTDASGNYSILAVPIGEYEITTEKTGFKEQIRRGVTLVVGQQAVVNLTLEVGNVEQQVTVTAEAPIVNTTLAPTSGLVGEQEVKDLPLNGRSFDQLLTLNVGTTNYSANTSHNAFSVAGRRPEANRFLINGVDYVGSDSSSQTVTPNSASGSILGVDAVREFNVVEPPYGAEYGKRGGGQITIVASSGTNELHGDLFEFLRNSDMDARNYFDFPVGTRLPPLKRNQFGGSLGGPIKKDKLFFFASYEGFRLRVGQSDVETVPDNFVRQGELPTGPNGSYVLVPNLQSGMLRFFPLWPVVNGPELLTPAGLPTGIADSFANPVQAIREDFGLAHLDYNASSKDSLSATFVDDDGENDLPNANTMFLGRSKSVNRLVSIQETRIFSPALLNVVTLGYSRAWTPSQTLPLVPIDPSLQFITGAGTGTITLGGVVTGGGATSVTSAGADTVPLIATRNLFTFADDVHLIKGNHSLGIGGWIQRADQALTGAPAAEGGSVSYSNLMAMLQDKPTQFIAVPNPTALYYTSTEAAWYVQDDYKMKPNLTLRLGIRDEMTNGWNEAHSNCANYQFTNGIINTSPFVSSSCLTQNNAKALWQPRVGFGWDPNGKGTWAVRGGFGTYNDLQDSLAHRLNSDPPSNARVSRTDPLLSFIPYPGGQQPAPSCSPTQPAPCSIFMVGGLEPNMHTPTVQEWDLTVERQLASNLALQVGYIGSQSYHLSASVDANEWAPLVCQNAAGCPSGGTKGAVGLAPQGALYQAPLPTPTITDSQLPNPYLANTFSWSYDNVSSYEALTVSLIERTMHGLSFKTNYTFGKIMDLNSAISGSNGTNEPMTIYDPGNLALNKGLAAYSIRHQFNTNFSYDLPFGKGKYFGSSASGMTDKIIGGWQWNGILTIQTGFPFTPQMGSNTSSNGDTFNPDVPNVNPAFTGSVVLGTNGFKTTGKYYNPAAFSIPTPGTYGDVSRGYLIGPGLTNFDTSLFKRVSLTERWRMELRVETFNIFNHANFKSPNAVVFSGTSVSPTAGTITAALPSRELQFAVKVLF